MPGTVVTSDVGTALRIALHGTRVEENGPLAPFTTFRVGGPAEWLVHAQRSEQVRTALMVAHAHGVPTTVLGGGSNVLIADAGIRGLVVRVHGGEATAVGPSRITADAGLTINGLVRWTVNRGISGLEMWAGTPGTVGGAIHGNAHFKGRLIGESIERVEIFAPETGSRWLDASALEFGYDCSRLQRTREVALSAEFHTGRGDPAVLRQTARDSLAFRKRTQPLESASAGCIFQNPDPAHDRVPLAIPPSAGALVDRAGLKDVREGGARVSPTHGNFIVNDGHATAEDIRRLIERCRATVHERFGVDLREEIVYLGFGEQL
jgi:UDP-N-acetylmuramate dehydrogenase